MKKKTMVIISVVLGVLLVAGILGAGAVFAAGKSNSYPPIVQKLADKLNVKAGDVDNAFDEIQQERCQELQKRIEEKLTQAVKDGKITEAQKAEILKRFKAIQEKQEELRELTQGLKGWADDNNIDLRDICGVGLGRGGGRGPGGPGGPGGGCFGPGPGEQ